jgi:hypothetical protein
MTEPKQEQKLEEAMPTWGLLAITHAYNEGKLTFKEWMRLSREWAEGIIQQYGTDEDKARLKHTKESE